jgi:hypothetical protein
LEAYGIFRMGLKVAKDLLKKTYQLPQKADIFCI